MKKTLITKVLTILTACGIAVSLTACGDSGQTEAPSNQQSPVTMSQAFGAKGIWFDAECPGKNESIGSVLVFDGKGNVTHYNTVNLTFKDLKGLSDEEIISAARKMDKEEFERVKGIHMEGLLESIELFREYPDSSEALARVEKAYSASEAVQYAEPRPLPYALHVETDSTGNATAKETLIVPIRAVENHDEHGEYDLDGEWFAYGDRELEFSTEDFSSTGNLAVYDSQYNGFPSAGLWTSVNESFMGFAVDTPDAKGVEVD